MWRQDPLKVFLGNLHRDINKPTLQKLCSFHDLEPVQIDVPTPKANQQALVLHNSLRIHVRTAGESRRKSILMSVLEGGNHLSLLEHCHRSLVGLHLLEGVAHHGDEQVQPARAICSAEPTNYM